MCAILYASLVFKHNISEFEKLNCEAAKLVSGNHKKSSNIATIIDLDWMTFEDIYKKSTLQIFHILVNLDDLHRIKKQYRVISRNPESLNNSDFWKRASVILKDMCTKIGISQSIFIKANKTQANKILKKIC